MTVTRIALVDTARIDTRDPLNQFALVVAMMMIHTRKHLNQVDLDVEMIDTRSSLPRVVLGDTAMTRTPRSRDGKVDLVVTVRAMDRAVATVVTPLGLMKTPEPRGMTTFPSGPWTSGGFSSPILETGCMRESRPMTTGDRELQDPAVDQEHREPWILIPMTVLSRLLIVGRWART